MVVVREMSVCWYGVWLRSVCVVSMIVQSLIKLRFCLTNVLYVDFLHSMRYMTKLLLQVVLWNAVYDFLVCWLVNEDVELICLQHRLVILVRHGRHFPLFFSFFSALFCYFLLWFCPIRSLRFLFLLYAMNGLSVKDVPSSWLIFNISQCFSIALFTGTLLRLY